MQCILIYTPQYKGIFSPLLYDNFVTIYFLYAIFHGPFAIYYSSIAYPLSSQISKTLSLFSHFMVL